MEELLEGLDIAELQKDLLSDPKMNQTVQAVLKNPEALSQFKNFFTGGSKWRNKHRKKRGSGGTHSKQMTSMYTPTPYYKYVGKNLKKFPVASSPKSKDKEMSPIRKRRDAIVDLMKDSEFGPLPDRESKQEEIHRLREEAEAIKKALLKKQEKDIKEGTKVMFGGKWSLKYKRSINCRKPKGFSQKQYCKRKNRKSKKKRKKSRKKRRRKKRKTRRKRR
jgi:hypothetical protein